MFDEYFHGAGLGASHQIGWTGRVGMLIEALGHVDPQQLLNEGKTGLQEWRTQGGTHTRCVCMNRNRLANRD